ncbi:MAG TPA: hypothetical protein VMV93_02660 [Chloroflexota bacterium]|nr:hypothetical protein [Chloroflexota bacterium]
MLRRAAALRRAVPQPGAVRQRAVPQPGAVRQRAVLQPGGVRQRAVLQPGAVRQRAVLQPGVVRQPAGQLRGRRDEAPPAVVPPLAAQPRGAQAGRGLPRGVAHPTCEP